MRATMQDRPLLISDLARHAKEVHGRTRVLTYRPEGNRVATMAEVAANAARLASGLRQLGVGVGDRVAALSWNTQEYLECYVGIPGLGAVIHTLNLRLSAEQLHFVITHADDTVIVVGSDLLTLIEPLLPRLPRLRTVIVHGDGALPDWPGVEVLAYADVLAGGDPEFVWPDLDERAAASMCHTSGTTGDPKGVVYSHRSTWLHAMCACSANALGINDRDTVLPMVAMFHGNAWGIPYACLAAGAEVLLVGRHLQPAPLLELIAATRPTLAGAVPTILNDLVTEAIRVDADLSCLRLMFGGGSAVPQSLIERVRDRWGVPFAQLWGMTETSPLVTASRLPRGADPTAAPAHQARTGRILAGTRMRIVDDHGQELPHDGVAVGEMQVAGPWITGSYHAIDAADRFQDGWLRTGDAGTIDPDGVVQLTDRLKDVIKSGGEWISSVDLELALLAHPAVAEAAVIAVAHPRWEERPLACIRLRDGAEMTPPEVREFLAPTFARWWLPENVAFVDEIPYTSVGKIDKKELRARHAAGAIKVHVTAAPGEAG